METITNLSFICLVILVLLQFNSRPLAKPDLLSGCEVRYPIFLIVAFWFAITFVAAFREGFVDTGVYKKLYGDIGTDYGNAFDETFAIQDYGFNLLMVFLHRITPNPQLMVFVTSIITFSIYIYTLAKYSQDLPFSLLLLLCMSYLNALNGIRQILAGAILLLGLPWVRDRKFIPYALLALVASTFHASALVMIPLYFVFSGRRLNWGIWAFYGCVALIFAAPGVANAVLGSLLEDSTYADYLQNESQMGTMRLLVAVVPVAVSVLYCMINKGNRNGEDIDCADYYSQRMVDILINMQLVSFGFTLLGLRMVYFARISMYFDCVLPLLLPVTLKHSFTAQSSRIVKAIAMVMYVLYYAYQIYTFEAYGYLYGLKLTFDLW